MHLSFDRPLARRIMRNLFWFTLSFAALFLVRVPFLLTHYIPFHLPFEPWVALIPLLGVMWGLPAVLAIGAVTALADWMAGLRDTLPAYHAIGMMCWAWSARALWTVRPPPAGNDLEQADAAPAVTWPASWTFFAVSLPGAAVAAVWMGLGADLTRSYPFGYVTRLTTWNHLAFLLCFAVVWFRVFERDIAPRFGSLDRHATTSLHPSRLGMILQIGGAAGAWLIGLAIAMRLGYPARGPVALGDTIGYRLLPAIVPFLILHAIGTACPKAKGGLKA